jgi:hypothetical protein
MDLEFQNCISRELLFSDGSCLVVLANLVSQYQVCSSFVSWGFLYEQRLWFGLMGVIKFNNSFCRSFRSSLVFKQYFCTFSAILGLCVDNSCFCRM